MEPLTTAQLLTIIREKNNFTSWYQVAKAAQADQSTVGHWRKGGVPTDTVIIMRLAELAGLEFLYVLLSLEAEVEERKNTASCIRAAQILRELAAEHAPKAVAASACFVMTLLGLQPTLPLY